MNNLTNFKKRNYKNVRNQMKIMESFKNAIITIN